MPVVERAENCEGPAVAALFKVADVPAVQVVMVPQVLCGCERPCIPVVQQRLVRSFFQRRYGGGDGAFFDAFCVIFRAPPVIPELSVSFWSPRW